MPAAAICRPAWPLGGSGRTGALGTSADWAVLLQKGHSLPRGFAQSSDAHRVAGLLASVLPTTGDEPKRRTRSACGLSRVSGEIRAEAEVALPLLGGERQGRLLAEWEDGAAVHYSQARLWGRSACKIS